MSSLCNKFFVSGGLIILTLNFLTKRAPIKLVLALSKDYYILLNIPLKISIKVGAEEIFTGPIAGHITPAQG